MWESPFCPCCGCDWTEALSSHTHELFWTWRQEPSECFLLHCWDFRQVNFSEPQAPPWKVRVSLQVCLVAVSCRLQDTSHGRLCKLSGTRAERRLSDPEGSEISSVGPWPVHSPTWCGRPRRSRCSHRQAWVENLPCLPVLYGTQCSGFSVV